MLLANKAGFRRLAVKAEFPRAPAGHPAARYHPGMRRRAAPDTEARPLDERRRPPLPELLKITEPAPESRLTALENAGGPSGLAAALGCDLQEGLSPAALEANRADFGTNKFPPPRHNTFFGYAALGLQLSLLTAAGFSSSAFKTALC